MSPRLIRHSAAAGLALLATAASAQTIQNGSMDGTPDIDAAPDFWQVAQASPDVVSTTGPFNNTGIPWTLSPNGGTFARMNGTGNDQSEAISQALSGFTPGTAYRLDYSLTNLGFQNAATGAWSGFDGFFRFLIDGSEVATSSTVTKQASGQVPIVWTTEFVEFTAPAADFTLTIYGETVGGSFDVAYLGFDGITARVVPAPASIALIASGALLARRRRA